MSRKPLPDRRQSWTQKFKVGGQTCHATFGEYEDGTLGEIFLDVAKTGTFVRGAAGFAMIQASISLQCGMPVEVLTSNLKCQSFPPEGDVSGGGMSKSELAWARSILEVVGRLVEEEYPNGMRRQGLPRSKPTYSGKIGAVEYEWWSGNGDTHLSSDCQWPETDGLRPVPHPSPRDPEDNVNPQGA